MRKRIIELAAKDTGKNRSKEHKRRLDHVETQGIHSGSKTAFV
jgi:hypothetical protein